MTILWLLATLAGALLLLTQRRQAALHGIRLAAAAWLWVGVPFLITLIWALQPPWRIPALWGLLFSGVLFLAIALIATRPAR